MSKLSLFSAQRIYYITVTVCSHEYGAENILTLSNIQQMSAIQHESCLSIHTYTHKIDADN